MFVEPQFTHGQEAFEWTYLKHICGECIKIYQSFNRKSYDR